MENDLRNKFMLNKNKVSSVLKTKRQQLLGLKGTVSWSADLNTLRQSRDVINAKTYRTPQQ